MIITIDHVAGCFYCRKGTRAFFKKYNLDYLDFLKHGIDEQILLALKDSMANRVVEFANGQH